MPYKRGEALADVYRRAKEGNYGFIASNITHLDILVGQLMGAEQANSDIVLQVKRDTAEYVGNGDATAGLRIIETYLEELAKDIDVGVFLNVDHIDVEDAAMLDASITASNPSSIMIDASEYPLEENIQRTATVVDCIDERDEPILVEAELGVIAGTESGETTEEALYTDPEEAVEFVDRSGCDLLAVSIGTEHGVSKGHNLDLRVDLAAEINEALQDHGLDIPLVVHGSSGLTPDQVSELMKTGVCKLNTNTRFQYEHARTACEFYQEHTDSIVPPEDTADDRATFFADSKWSPRKSDFNPQVVGELVRERIADVYNEIATTSGSAQNSVYK
ncbi:MULTISPECIES: class II fructose-bisphosphate aldolase [Natrialbaceae]|uniref:class II fructose-bisphosphate aldolase n=1 Tax=Natrialbaceae TaxID=1644061 RepID=UPI00207D2CDF|nr:class II fructose-bisphosphate aldolase [Natronococcus sp. CG52]